MVSGRSSLLGGFRASPWGCLAPGLAALGGLLTGWDVGYVGTMLESRSFLDDVNKGSPLSGAQSGALVALQPAASAVVALPFVGGALVERVGRRGTLALSGLLCLAGAATQASARSLWQVCAGRVVLGLSLGFNWVCPVYQSEVAPKEARGAVVGLFPLALALGVFVANICSFALQGAPHGWALCIYPMAVFGGVQALGMLFCPESPRHLLHAGQRERARQVLSRLRQGRAEGYVELEWALMQQELDAERALGRATCQALCSGFVGRLLAVAVAGWLLFQLCGMPALSYFGPKMFKMARVDAFAFQAMSTGLGFLVTLPALWLVDSSGRKPLLKWGAAGMGLSMLGLGLVGMTAIVVPDECPGSRDPTDCAHSPGDPPGSVRKPAQCAIVLFSLAFYTSYCVSWGAVMSVFGNEIFPIKFRSRASAASAFASMAGNFCMGQFAPIMLDHLRFGTFVIFAVIDAACFAFACWIPETAGAQLEEVIPLFERRLGVKYAPDS